MLSNFKIMPTDIINGKKESLKDLSFYISWSIDRTADDNICTL